MASSSGNSSGSTSLLLQNSGSEGDVQVVMEQRKRKRMESNRESARRSRMRKQKHWEDLMAQVTQMRKENNQILSSINITTQNFLNVEAENSVLKAQMMELSHRLDSLNEILHYINSTTTSNYGIFETEHHQDAVQASAAAATDCFMNPLLNTLYLNQQPLMASPDFFQY